MKDNTPPSLVLSLGQGYDAHADVFRDSCFQIAESDTVFNPPNTSSWVANTAVAIDDPLLDIGRNQIPDSIQKDFLLHAPGSSNIILPADSFGVGLHLTNGSYQIKSGQHLHFKPGIKDAILAKAKAENISNEAALIATCGSHILAGSSLGAGFMLYMRVEFYNDLDLMLYNSLKKQATRAGESPLKTIENILSQMRFSLLNVQALQLGGQANAAQEFMGGRRYSCQVSQPIGGDLVVDKQAIKTCLQKVYDAVPYAQDFGTQLRKDPTDPGIYVTYNPIFVDLISIMAPEDRQGWLDSELKPVPTVDLSFVRKSLIKSQSLKYRLDHYRNHAQQEAPMSEKLLQYQKGLDDKIAGMKALLEACHGPNKNMEICTSSIDPLNNPLLESRIPQIPWVQSNSFHQLCTFTKAAACEDPAEDAFNLPACRNRYQGYLMMDPPSGFQQDSLITDTLDVITLVQSLANSTDPGLRTILSSWLPGSGYIIHPRKIENASAQDLTPLDFPCKTLAQAVQTLEEYATAIPIGGTRTIPTLSRVKRLTLSEGGSIMNYESLSQLVELSVTGVDLGATSKVRLLNNLDNLRVLRLPAPLTRGVTSYELEGLPALAEADFSGNKYLRDLDIRGELASLRTINLSDTGFTLDIIKASNKTWLSRVPKLDTIVINSSCPTKIRVGDQQREVLIRCPGEMR